MFIGYYRDKARVGSFFYLFGKLRCSCELEEDLGELVVQAMSNFQIQSALMYNVLESCNHIKLLVGGDLEVESVRFTRDGWKELLLIFGYRRSLRVYSFTRKYLKSSRIRRNRTRRRDRTIEAMRADLYSAL